jgi:hypothetical protein
MSTNERIGRCNSTKDKSQDLIVNREKQTAKNRYSVSKAHKVQSKQKELGSRQVVKMCREITNTKFKHVVAFVERGKRGDEKMRT